MNKNLLYGLIFSILFVAFILIDLVDPSKGFLFILEESVTILFLLSGVLLFRKPVSKIITQLNISFSWLTALKKRISIELFIIILATLLISISIYTPTSLYLKKNGTPEFYQNILNEKDRLNSLDDPYPKEVKHRKKVFDLDDLLRGICLTSFLCFIFIFGVEEIYIYVNEQSKKKLEYQILLKEQAQLRANVLQKQLDPHFMFNSLNVLSGLIYQDVGNSAEFIKELSKVYRYVLEQSDELVSTVEQEFNFLDSYIYLLKIRFDDKILLDFNISPNRKNWLLPSMTLELLVENAIKHNIIDQNQPLHLKFIVDENNLVVKNNLQLRKKSDNSLGIGLNNLKKRLDLLGVKNYSFSIIDKEFVAIVTLINPENV